MKDLLLLHGALGHSGYFDFLLQQLSETFVVHTPLFAGHADFDWNVEPLSVEGYTRQLEDYCQTKGLKTVSIFGYSMGGYVGLNYAAQHPEAVSAIMTLATKFDWNPQTAAKEAAMLQPETIAQKVPKFAAQLAKIHGAENWAPLTEAVAQLLLSLGNKPLFTDQALSSIKAKVQLMVGDRDNMVSIDETRAAVDKIPGAHFAVLPDTVHPFERIHQGLLLQLMRDFFTLRD